MTEDSGTGLSSWFERRPRWTRIAAAQLWSGRALDQQLIDHLETCCIGEAHGTLDEHVPPFPDTEETSKQAGELRLTSLSEPTGINALAPRKPLSFGTANLVIIYGRNGSGKSGYARILKHVCGARRPRELHPNIFDEGDGVRGCKVAFSVANAPVTRDWTVGTDAIPELRGAVLFDSDAADVYLNEECEVVYEPRVLALFTDLVQVSNSVAAGIDVRRRELPTALPKLPPKYETTPTGGWFKQLSALTTAQDVASRCAWTDLDNAELARLRKSLSEPTNEQQIEGAKRSLEHVQSLIAGALSLRSVLDDAQLEALNRLRADRDVAEAAAKVSAESTLAAGLLPSIGQPVWRKLWDAAREYSQKEAYVGKQFPNTEPGARCVLCQEQLQPDASRRLEAFDAFVRGELARKSREARAAFEQAAKALDWTVDAAAIRTKLDAAGASDKGLQDKWLALHLGMVARRDAAIVGGAVESLPSLPTAEDVKSVLRQHEAAVSELAARTFAANPDTEGMQMSAKVLELEARQWVGEQRAAVEAEIERKRRLAVLDKAKDSTSTTALSRKKGELADVLISKAFRERFDAELVQLGGKRVRVKLEQTRVDHGRALHQMQMNAPTHLRPVEVVSDGERRVITLAAFLADATGSPAPTPFIFDDPISSLDQDFEEAVVARLVSLAKSRQVIVFTHRLSLLVLLQEAAKKEHVETETVCVRSEAWGVGEPSDIPLDGKAPIKGLKKLRDERLARAKKAYTELGSEEYAPQAKAICSDLRILLERVVEVDLLADVVQRFRRGIQTQNKIQKLAAITEADVTMIDRLMTKYSIYEHSQPTESPVDPLLPDELNSDLTEIINWHAEFSNRAASTGTGSAAPSPASK